MQAASPIQKSVPFNLEAEKTLLGSILLDDAALNIALETLKVSDFYSEANRITFQKMVELSEKNHAIELVALADSLEREGLLEKVGGRASLASLVDGVPVASNSSAASYTRIIKEKAIVRNLINASQNIIARCYEEADDPETLLDLAQSQIFEIAETDIRTGFYRVPDIVKSSFGTLDVLFEQGHGVTGVETGFERLDSMTSGLQPGELIILAARPSLGKTALALNIAAHAATTQKKTTAIFSLEMSKESLLIRLLCSEGRIDSHKLRTGFASQDDWVKMSKALGRLSEAPIFIDDTPALSIMQIRAKARRLKADNKGLDLIIVDYLQLITGHGRFENRNQEVSYISRSLKGIAKELRVPVIALSQLSRAPEAGKGRDPELSDLRESGAIEQDADVVIFILKPSATDDSGDEYSGKLIEFKIAKQRNGPTGPFKLVFIKPHTRFENPAAGEEME